MHACILFLSALVAASTASASPSAQPGSIPTVTLPAASDLPSGTQSVSFSATPSGSAVAVEAGENGDVYVSFSSDTQDKISDIYKTKCGKSQDQAACEKAIGDVITADQVQVEGRNPLAVGSLFVLIVAMVMKRLEDDVKAPQLIKFKPDDYAQVSSAASQTPTALVIHDGSSTYTLTDPLAVAPKVTTLGGGGDANVTSSKCPTTPIICQDDECMAAASSKKTCEVSSNKGCKCTNGQAIETGQQYDTSSGSMQASILMSLSAAALTSDKPAKPSCFPNSNGPGTMKASPATWCVCSQSIDPAASNTIGKAVFSTISGKSGSSDMCDYSTMPTQTISISSSSSKVDSTTCSMITTTITSVPSGVSMTTGSTTWCTCNDGNQVGELTTSAGSQTSKYCPNGPTPKLLSTSDPKPTQASCPSFNSCPQNDGSCGCCNGPEFPRDVAAQAVSSICSSLDGKPFPTSDPGGGVFASTGQRDIKYSDTDYTINVRISPQVPFNAKNKIQKDSCISAALSAVDNCDQGTTPIKRGGSYIIHGKNGYQEYDVYRS